MINIKIMCVGKIKDKNLLSLINEYQKRISKYAKLEIIDVEDEKIPSSLSSMDMENIKEKEIIVIYNKYNYALGLSIKVTFDDGSYEFVTEDKVKSDVPEE